MIRKLKRKYIINKKKEINEKVELILFFNASILMFDTVQSCF